MDYKLESATPPETSDWDLIRTVLPQRKTFMEIGVYQGRSVIWTVENLLDDGGCIICIDPWTDRGYEQIEADFDYNMDILRERNPSKTIIKEKARAINKLCELVTQNKKFDFIYIDADKDHHLVLFQSFLAWTLLEVGGILMWDDYTSDTMDSKLGINSFIFFHKEELHLYRRGKRCIVQKVKK
jgi:predicted O-methyltransferase YrrM